MRSDGTPGSLDRLATTLLSNLATICSVLGNYSEARPLFEETLRGFRMIWREHSLYATEQQRLGILANVAEFFPAYFSFCLRHHAEAPGLSGQMYDAVLKVTTGGGVAGSTAYRAFWKPLEVVLGEKKRVYLSPDGVLSMLYLGLIPRDDGRLVMEVYDLCLLSSTRELLRARQAPGNQVAVLLGNPQFSLGAAPTSDRRPETSTGSEAFAPFASIASG